MNTFGTNLGDTLTTPAFAVLAQQRDITEKQGEAILREAQTYDGTPYTQSHVPPNNTKGQKGPKSGIDCSHLVL